MQNWYGSSNKRKRNISYSSVLFSNNHSKNDMLILDSWIHICYVISCNLLSYSLLIICNYGLTASGVC